MAVPAISAGLQVLGAGFSIIQGIQAKRAQREAEAQAARALEEAKSRLEVNRMEGLQVPLEAYELAERGLTAQQMQSTQALAEADSRSLAAGVGRSQLAAQEGQEQLRQQMAQDIFNRDKLIAGEQSRIDRDLAGISLAEVEGAQLAAMQREQQAAAGFTGGIQGLAGAGQTLYEQSDLFGSGRQGELDAAEALQKQGMYEGMNVRQARRSMLGTYSPEEIGRLSLYGTTYGKKNPFSSFSSKAKLDLDLPSFVSPSLLGG